MNLFDLMNELGHQVRYGVGANEKYQMMMSGQVPGQPKPFLPSGEENPEAVRYLSNYLGAQQWGEKPTSLVNHLRFLLDRNAPVYEAGARGAQAANPLNALMRVMGR